MNGLRQWYDEMNSKLAARKAEEEKERALRVIDPVIAELDRSRHYNVGESFRYGGLVYTVGVKPWRQEQDLGNGRFVKVYAGGFGDSDNNLRYGVSVEVLDLSSPVRKSLAHRIVYNVEVCCAERNHIGGTPSYAGAWLSRESLEDVCAYLAKTTETAEV